MHIIMKYRRLPFGYGYSEGKIMIDPKESKIITEIVQMYLERFSLMSIAQALTARKIEIAPGLTDWNKARVMHLLADERYLGNERFPQIIDKGTFEEIKAIRQEKNCRAEWNADADVFKLSPPVQCPCCQAKMQRKHDSRCRQKIRWLCTNRECGEIIPMADEILIGGVSKIVNSLANNPENVQIPLQAQVQQTKDIMQKRNEIRNAEVLYHDGGERRTDSTG